MDRWKEGKKKDGQVERWIDGQIQRMVDTKKDK